MRKSNFKDNQNRVHTPSAFCILFLFEREVRERNVHDTAVQACHKGAAISEFISGILSSHHTCTSPVGAALHSQILYISKMLPSIQAMSLGRKV
jgi:hypothetical protein